MRFFSALSAIAVSTVAASADTPQVVVDIAPLHSLTALVMEGVGSPDLILPPNASPHDFALRPSDARKLSDADVVIWMGEALTPWLEAPIESLSSGDTLEILASEGWEKRSYPAHDDHDTHEDGHAHGEAHHDHETHEHDAHGHSHDHSGLDPHAWLDPVNAALWVEEIAALLSSVDPDHAQTYARNAANAQDTIHALTQDLTHQLGDVQGAYILSHEAYGYFTARFGIEPAQAIASGDAVDPGPARIKELREHIAEHDIRCVFSDPEINPQWANLVSENSGVPIVALDPIGQDIAPGAAQYTALLTHMADAFSTCLAAKP